MKQIKTSTFTFGKVLKQYYKSDDFTYQYSESTQNAIRKSMIHAESILNVDINTITINDIKRIIENLEHSGKHSTAKSFSYYICKFFTFAYTKRYTNTNITKALKYDDSNAKPKFAPLSKSELSSFISQLINDSDVDLEIKIALYSQIVTLIPADNLVKLTFDNVNFKSGIFSMESIKSIDNFKMLLPTQIMTLWKYQKNHGKAQIINISINTFKKEIKELSSKYLHKSITSENLRQTARDILVNDFEVGDYNTIRTALMLSISKRPMHNHLMLSVERYRKSYNSLFYNERAVLSQQYADLIDDLVGNNIVGQIIK